MSAQIGKIPPGSPQIVHLRGRATGTDEARLIDGYSAHLFDYCQVLLRNPDAAAGAFQATREEATTRIDQVPGGDQARGWLYAMARRQCQHWRSGQVVAAGPAAPTEPVPAPARYALRVPAAETAGCPPGGQPPRSPAAASDDQTADVYTAEFGPSDLAATERNRETARLQYVLDGLPEGDREVLNLAFRHDMAAADLAGILKLSLHQAGKVLSAAATAFEQRSIGVILTRQGWVGCLALDKVMGDMEDDAPLTRRICRRVAQHSRKCVVCGQIVANWAFGPEALSQLPLATPPTGVERRILPKRHRQPTVPPVPAAASEMAASQVAGVARVAETRQAAEAAQVAEPGQVEVTQVAEAAQVAEPGQVAEVTQVAEAGQVAEAAQAGEAGPAARANMPEAAPAKAGFPAGTRPWAGFPARTDARAEKVSEPVSGDRQATTVAAGPPAEENPSLRRPSRSRRWAATAAAVALLVVVAGGLLIGALLLKPAGHSRHAPKAVPAAIASAGPGSSAATSQSGKPSHGAGSASARATPPGDVYAPLSTSPVNPAPQPAPTPAPPRPHPTPTPRPKGSHSASPTPSPSSSSSTSSGTTSASPSSTPSGTTSP